jgi:hypothetical protein
LSPVLLAPTFSTSLAGVDARLQKLLRQTNDNAVLNRTVVESWLQRIADVAQRADLPNFDPEPFIGVANLVVSLLWTLRADSLLTLLRDYAATGKFDITAVDQDALVREVQTVLQEPTLELFSRRNIVKENEGGPANPWLVRNVDASTDCVLDAYASAVSMRLYGTPKRLCQATEECVHCHIDAQPMFTCNC